MRRAAALAAASDVAIVFLQTLSRENGDRMSLSLNHTCPTKGCYRHMRHLKLFRVRQQPELIAAVAAANVQTVAVLFVTGPVLTPFRHDVAALLVSFMPGEQAGEAIADVLFGDVNPSGRLPVTFPDNEDQTARLRPTRAPAVDYTSEGLLVGYRYYDALGLTPAFPFGHGLSYTTFAYSALRVLVHAMLMRLTQDARTPWSG